MAGGYKRIIELSLENSELEKTKKLKVDYCEQVGDSFHYRRISSRRTTNAGFLTVGSMELP